MENGSKPSFWFRCGSRKRYNTNQFVSWRNNCSWKKTGSTFSISERYPWNTFSKKEWIWKRIDENVNHDDNGCHEAVQEDSSFTHNEPKKWDRNGDGVFFCEVVQDNVFFKFLKKEEKTEVVHGPWYRMDSNDDNEKHNKDNVIVKNNNKNNHTIQNPNISLWKKMIDFQQSSHSILDWISKKYTHFVSSILEQH